VGRHVVESECLVLLAHDHAQLTSQVEHVGSLLRGIVGRRFDPQSVAGEVEKQYSLLLTVIESHFELEESRLLVHLCNFCPDIEPRLAELVSDHRRIELVLGVVSDQLRAGALGVGVRISQLCDDFGRFETAYFDHLDAEAHLFEEIAGRLSPEQRAFLTVHAFEQNPG